MSLSNHVPILLTILSDLLKNIDMAVIAKIVATILSSLILDLGAHTVPKIAPKSKSILKRTLTNISKALSKIDQLKVS